MKLDSYGNIGRGQLQKILSGLGAQGDRHQNSTDSIRSRANLRRYFIMKRGSEPIGIAERTGTKRGQVQILIAFISKPGYAKALDFFGIGETGSLHHYGAMGPFPHPPGVRVIRAPALNYV